MTFVAGGPKGYYNYTNCAEKEDLNVPYLLHFHLELKVFAEMPKKGAKSVAAQSKARLGQRFIKKSDYRIAREWENEPDISLEALADRCAEMLAQFRSDGVDDIDEDMLDIIMPFEAPISQWANLITWASNVRTEVVLRKSKQKRNQRDAKRVDALRGSVADQNGLLATIPNAPETVSIQTARRWMYYLNFMPTKRDKNYYVDGHEREDVVQYRELFLQRMLEYERRSERWEGPNLDISIPPTLGPGEKKLVMVTHDESIFYSNEAVAVIWEEGESQTLRPKSRGKSQHVSGFCCACHGFIHDYHEFKQCSSFQIITPGKNEDGYWTNDDLVKQLSVVMPLFERQHPGCDLLFMFDNSGNHHKKTPGGLWAWDRNKDKDGGAMTLQRPGWWVDRDGVRHEQSMTLPPLVEGGPLRAKACRTIITERGGWDYDVSADAARARLSSYPDFMEQREWLAETVETAGHTIDYYPKFHCELNFIENVWAYCKAILRRRCTYSFPAMRAILPQTLYDVPVSFCRRVQRHCSRFASGYRTGLHGPILDYVMKKYKGHRTIPLFVGEELERIEREYLQKRFIKLEPKLKNL